MIFKDTDYMIVVLDFLIYNIFNLDINRNLSRNKYILSTVKRPKENYLRQKYL